MDVDVVVHESIQTETAPVTQATTRECILETIIETKVLVDDEEESDYGSCEETEATDESALKEVNEEELQMAFNIGRSHSDT
jgi:hypothetical protein